MARTRPTTAPGTVTEDIEDLKAQVRALAAQVKRLTTAPAEGTEVAAAAAEEGEPETEEDGWEFPPFILLLNEKLRALAEWVEGVLVPGYLAEPSADTRWCHLWTEHAVAIARLHALWLAWQELTDPATCGYSGPSTWHRDHYDPRALMACPEKTAARSGSTRFRAALIEPSATFLSGRSFHAVSSCLPCRPGRFRDHADHRLRKPRWHRG